MAKHLAIVGSPGSGKSVFAAALAKEATKRKKRAIIVSGDSIIPMLPFFCGNTDTQGLGSLFEGDITPQRVAKVIKVLKEDANIGVIGRKICDDLTFISEEKIRTIAEILDRLTDVVIW
ncbi:MAG: ATP-binding protein, partial [Anaerotignum sp.]|nr:ATP-binding protein [Anaerotignum sp.]